MNSPPGTPEEVAKLLEYLKGRLRQAVANVSLTLDDLGEDDMGGTDAAVTIDTMFRAFVASLPYDCQPSDDQMVGVVPAAKEAHDGE